MCDVRIAAQTPALPPLQLRRRDPFALAIVNGRKKSEILTTSPPGYVDGETVRVLVLRSRSRVRLAGKVSDLCAGKVLRGARGGTCVYEMVGLVSMRRRCTVSRDAAGAWPAAVANAVSEWPSPLRAAARSWLVACCGSHITHWFFLGSHITLVLSTRFCPCSTSSFSKQSSNSGRPIRRPHLAKTDRVR